MCELQDHLITLDAPIPEIEDLIKRLFSKRWTNLHTEQLCLEDEEYPGVYVLAYSEDDLEGKQVKEEQVFYVGMSHSLKGIKGRINQFRQGIEKGEGHSGGNRFYEKFADQVPYSQLQNKKTFYVASVTVRCTVNKDKREAEDLRKMGEVARLEYYVLAHIKDHLHKEPELNKK